MDNKQYRNNHTVVSKKSKRQRPTSRRKLITTLVVISIIGIVILINYFNSRSNQGILADLSANMLTSVPSSKNNIISIEEEEKQLAEANILAEQLEETEKSSAGTYKVDSSSPYYIKVNSGANCVTVYSKDSNGDYTIPIKAMICSCGEYTTPMWKYPNSVYKLTGNKYDWLPLEDDVHGQFATQIVGNILFHSVPYLEPAKNKLKWWEFDKLGTSASAGCVRLQVKDAEWIYYNCPAGTYVEFYSSSDPGPLGKPSARKISDITSCRDWDPTDSDGNNPWHNYSEPVQDTHHTTQEESNTNTNSEPEQNEVNINTNTSTDSGNSTNSNSENTNTTINEINNETEDEGNNTTESENTIENSI